MKKLLASRIVSVAGTLLLILVFTPSTSRADPIFITSGTLTVTGTVGGPRFSLSGDNFFASGGGERGASNPQTACRPCLSGQFITVTSNFIGSSLEGGFSIINGVERSGGFAGAFMFTGPPIEIPFSLSNLTLTSPFNFSGSLIGCPQSCVVGPTIFSVTLTGSGIATIDLSFSGLIGGVPSFTFQRVTFNFDVPEPISLILLSGGLAALAAKLKANNRAASKK